MVGCSGDGAAGSASDSVPAMGTESAAPAPPPALAAATPEAVAEPGGAEPSAPAAPAASGSQEAGMVLDGEGIGAVRFGDRAEDVIAALDAAYGPPDHDTDWMTAGQQPGPGGCPGTRLRIVRYGQLQVLMSDGPTNYGAAGQPHLFGYTVFAVDTDRAAPQTAEGIRVGSTVADLRAAFGDSLVVRDDDPTLTFSFSVTRTGGTDPLFGYLTDATQAGLVTAIVAGQRCGE